MREYAEDVDIAPIELIIVVRTDCLSILWPANDLPPPISCRASHVRRSPYYYRTRATHQGFPLVQTSATYLTFITLGDSSCVCMTYRSSRVTVV